jgi:hypothetical protein
MTSADESLANSFKDNFSYIAAFLSALVGLAAFKNEAESFTLFIVSRDFTLLELALPFVIFMILAAYVGALAIQSKTMRFTLFPLTKGLEWAANVSALIGLAYPLLILFAYLFTQAAFQVTQGIPGADNPELLRQVLSGVSTAIVVVITLPLVIQTSSNKLKERYKNKSRTLLIEYAKMLDAGKTTNTTDILSQRHILTSLVKGVLSLKGYSVGGDDLLHMSKKLADLGIFSSSDLDNITAIQSAYDAISQGTPLPARPSIKELREIIDTLAAKLRDTVVKNV